MRLSSFLRSALSCSPRTTWRLLALTSLVIGSTVFASPAALAQSAPSAGEKLYQSKGCMACHGLNGAAPVGDAIPNLHRQPAAYLLRQLQAFKTLKRDSANSSAMWTFSQMLTRTEMRQISRYLSRVKQP